MKYLTFQSAPTRPAAAGSDPRSALGRARSRRTTLRFDTPPAVAAEGEIEEWLRDAPAIETASLLIANLIAEVVELGLPSRMTRSLESKLTTAIALLASPEPATANQSVAQLKSFVRRIEAMSGARISKADAEALVDKASEIIERI